MKKLTVRYHYGETNFIYHNASAAQVQQVLTKINPELVKVCGVYDWQLTGQPGDYKIIAKWKNNRWTESTGKSPSAALKNFPPARQILEKEYGIKA